MDPFIFHIIFKRKSQIWGIYSPFNLTIIILDDFTFDERILFCYG